MLVCMIIEETKEQERNQHPAFEEETSDWYERHPCLRDADQRLRTGLIKETYKKLWIFTH